MCSSADLMWTEAWHSLIQYHSFHLASYLILFGGPETCYFWCIELPLQMLIFNCSQSQIALVSYFQFDKFVSTAVNLLTVHALSYMSAQISAAGARSKF